MRGKIVRNFILTVLTLLFAGVAVFAGREAWGVYSVRAQSADAYEDLEARYISVPTAARKIPLEGGGGAAPEGDKGDIPFPEVDFDALREVNGDVIAWLYLPDSTICHPVVQTTNNDKYLYVLFDGTENITGCPFVEYRNSPDFTDPNTIIYGHHMRDGGMFADVEKFKEQDYYDRHPCFLLMTPEKNYVIRVFAGYVASTDMDAWRLSFQGEQDFLNWIDGNIALSAFTSPVRPTAEDRIVTISTCSYEFEDARFVLFGVLEER